HPSIACCRLTRCRPAPPAAGVKNATIPTTPARWRREKDDNPKKLAARRMLAMVQQINQTHFDGQNRINCASCHHGANRPLPYPPIVDASHVDRFTATAQLDAKDKEALPTLRAVVDRFVSAIGGRDANARITAPQRYGTGNPGRRGP